MWIISGPHSMRRGELEQEINRLLDKFTEDTGMVVREVTVSSQYDDPEFYPGVKGHEVTLTVEKLD